MPLNETVNLNITEAQRQISVLESQLDQLARPLTIPVTVTGEGGLDSVRRDLDSSETAVSDLNRELAQTDDLLRDTGRDARRAGDDLDSASRKGATGFGGLRTSLVALGGTLVAFAGAQAVGRFLTESITAASSLEQSVGALDAVFGELGDEIAAFGEVAGDSVGLAASQFNQLAAVLGSQLQTFGFNVDDAATETQRLIGLASDLAATFGGPVSQAVEAVSSLLRGETNPIERYGVAMNEAAIQARALEDGLAASASELTFQDKTMARLAILYEQTANAQGQFGREADTTAGQMERLNAEFENTQAQIGEALVPTFGELLTQAQNLIPVLEGLAPVVGLLAEAGAGVVLSFEPILDLFGLLAQPVRDVIAALEEAQGIDGSGIENVSESARALFENTEAALPLLEEFGTFLATGFDSASLRDAFLELGNAIEGGVDPLSAARQALQLFAREGTLTEEILLGVVETAALTSSEIAAIRIAAREGDFGFLSPAELLAVEQGLEGFIDVGGRFEGRATGVGNAIRGLADATEDADGIPPTLQEVGASLTNLINGMQELDQIGQVEISNPFAQLPTELDAAAAAMETTEGEIVTDFSTFLENLEAELAAQREFGANIAALFELGLDDLAQTFLDAGIESAGLLADGLTDPAELARAEAALDAAAYDLAVSEVDAFAAALEGQLDGVNITPIKIPIVSDFTGFVIPGSISQGADFAPAPTGGTGGSGVQVFNTYTGFTPTSTDLAKASMITSSIIKSNVS